MAPKRSWSEFVVALLIAAAAFVVIMVTPKSQTAITDYPNFQPVLPLVY